MDLVEIKERGSLNKERIVFRATVDIDLGYYLVFIVHVINDTSFSSAPEAVFWFPDKEVKKDDLVVIYTKSGTNTFKKNSSGVISHFFYWGLAESQFNDSTQIPVLLEAKGWDAFFNKA